MKKILALAILSPLLSLAAQTENVVIYKKTEGVIEQSSEHNRMGKNHQLTAQLGGINPTGLPGAGLSYGYYLNRNSMIVAEITGSDRDDKELIGSSYNVESSSVGVHYKQFFGNSFYVRTGIDQRHVNLKFNYTSPISSSSNTAYGFKGDSTAASLVIGNQWQWDNFTLGCDWIGLSTPLVRSTKGEYITASASNYAYEERSMKDDKRWLTKRTNGQAIRFYLGASF